MARGPSTPATPVPLPKVSFVKVQDDGSTKPAGVHDGQARSYGYNDFSDFNRPEHYIRHIEPLESELAVQVEYDMDEQDQEWLDAVNVERKKEQLNGVSYETFEIVMDRLEKEWFDLTKNIPKPDMALPSEDSTCAICDDSEGENSNAIVFCDGCNLAVHQDCYGVPYIPEGQWLCRKCTVSPEIPVSCVLCPNEGGAFKQTIHGEWVHLLCAIWVPETRVANEVFMEPITGLDKVSKQRWKLKCSICGIREGACVQCSKTSCFLAFHATCARKEKFLMPMKSTQGTEAIALTCFCEKHLPKEQLDIRMAALAADGLDGNTRNARLSKSARAYAKTYKPGPPLVPNLIVERIMQYIGKVVVRKKPEFILMMCKYWSLKREARRGAPLLKRLHLEPWTASSGNKLQTNEEKAMKLEQLRRLRNDLFSVRKLAEFSKEREIRKRDQIEIIQDLLMSSIFPHEPEMRMTFEKIMTHDRNEYFKNPVSKADVPDYFDIVKRPMCWNVIDSKLDRHEYWDIQAFKDDVQLVLSNAILYNKAGTAFYKSAQRLQVSSETLFAELEGKLASHGFWHPAPTDNEANAMDISLDSQMSIGSLEPPLNILELLLSEEAIADEIELILKEDPLASLFSFEFEVLKPPPPPPPPKPPKPKRVRNRQAAKERRTAKEVAVLHVLDVSPGFRAPRTRKGMAAAAAFEAEARAEGEVETNQTLDPAEKHSRKEAAKQRGKAWKRGPLVLPGRSEVPPIVDEVDKRQSFKMFDAGWILPENQKRGGRAAIERMPLPPPRKRMRTNHETSRLSVLSTSASENQTLRLLIDDEVSGDAQPDNNAMDVDILGGDDSEMSSPLSEAKSDVEAPTSAKPSKRPTPPLQNIIHSPDGTIIVETLDTPALRREKTIRRRVEKARRAAEAEVEASASAGPSRLPASGSSSLTDLEADEEEDSRDLSSGIVSASAPPRPKDPAVVVLDEGETLEGGTLVWAKAPSYPWWPAVIFELDDPGIPKNILEGKEVRRKRGGPLHLARFFDKSSSWLWAEAHQLLLMFENIDLDSELLAKNSKKQRWRNSTLRESCREAFRRAEAERQLDGEPDPENLVDDQSQEATEVLVET